MQRIILASDHAGFKLNPAWSDAKIIFSIFIFLFFGTGKFKYSYIYIVYQIIPQYFDLDLRLIN